MVLYSILKSYRMQPVVWDAVVVWGTVVFGIFLTAY